MSLIGEAKANIMAGHGELEEVQGGLEQQKSKIGDAQQRLHQEAEDSDQADSDQAAAQLTSAVDSIDNARQAIALAMQLFQALAAGA